MAAAATGSWRQKGGIELLILSAVFLLCLGPALLWLSTTYRSWPGTMFERRVLRQEPMTDETAPRIRERIRGLEAGWLSGSHVHLPGLAAQLTLQGGGLAGLQREEIFAQGRASTRLALARDPARAHAWARLASYRMLAEGPSAAVVAALRMSIYTAPSMPSLVFWRIRTAASCRAFWDAEFEGLVKRQIVLAARISASRLQAAAAGSGLEQIVREVIENSD